MISWYKIAKNEHPYQIFQIMNGVETPVPELKDEREWATSAFYARNKFLWNNKFLQDRLNEFSQVNGSFNFEAKRDEDREDAIESTKKMKDEQYKDMWYNDN